MAAVQRVKGSYGATGPTYSSTDDSKIKPKDIRLADARTESEINVGGKGNRVFKQSGEQWLNTHAIPEGLSRSFG